MARLTPDPANIFWRKVSAGLALALAVSFSTNAAAQETYPVWQLARSGDISVQLAPGDKGTEIATYRMFPAAMLVLDEDYFQDNGRLAAPAGTQLIVVQGATGAACAIFPPKLALGAAIMAWGADRNLCFLDRNLNGKFEEYYFQQGNSQGFYNVIRALPADPKVGSGGGYSIAQPADMDRGLVWTVTFRDCKIVTKNKKERPRCRINVALDVLKENLETTGGHTLMYGKDFDVYADAGALPLPSLGLRVTADWSDPAVVDIRIVQDSPVRPFVLQ